MLPKQEAVWGVTRTYNFATAEWPSLQNALDALHKKYGPESVPADPDPRNNTKGIAWVYDGREGHLALAVRNFIGLAAHFQITLETEAPPGVVRGLRQGYYAPRGDIRR